MKVVLDASRAAPVVRTMAPTTKRRFRDALRALARDPSGRSVGLDVKRLDVDGGVALWRLRVGDWRAAFTVDEATVVLRVFHRSEGYGWVADLE